MISRFRSALNLRFFIKVVFAALILSLIVWYLGFQARNLLSGPEITLSTEPSPIQHERLVSLEGTAKNITALTLNGNPIFTDEEGAFRKQLVLENGYTIMTLRATDRFGRETILTRSFVYTP